MFKVEYRFRYMYYVNHTYIKQSLENEDLQEIFSGWRLQEGEFSSGLPMRNPKRIVVALLRKVIIVVEKSATLSSFLT